MIFDLESLICPYCNKYLDEPKVLPCGENACSKCLPETGNFNCLLCSESHSVSTNGYPINKILSKALENTIKSEKLDNKAQSFMVNIEDTEKKLSELKLKMVQLEAEVVQNCNSIINEIDLTAEDKINQINNIREDLIKEVKEYQDRCLNNLTKFSKDHAQLLDQVNLLRKDIDLILTRKNFHDKLDKYYNIKSEVEIGLKKIRNLSLDYRKIKFDACESELEKDFLGTVSFKNLKKKNLNELKQPIKVDFSDMFLENGSIKFNKLENGNFLLSYIKLNINYEKVYHKDSSGFIHSRQQKKETYEYIISNLSSNKTLKISVKNNLLDHDVYTFENFIFLMSIKSKYIKKYDSNLTLLKTVSLSESASLLLPTQKFVLVYFNSEFNGPLMNLYDFDLNFVITIKNNEYNSFLNIPNTIKKMFINDKFYFFQEEDNSITVVNQDDGTFFKKIDPYPTKFENIVKITNDFIIISHRFNTLEFRNSNGYLSDYIEYDSYNFIALIDDHNEIFLMNSLKNQFHTDKFE
ncbi:unnamed protein product [Brachionus calyciflorus]|uniref:RING-type domain-containing protein n=1 Tax=Brachionus calyciflorus TaxID=104777 RepID=A0A814DDN8_9BILA|nr:unnamed protein product [Brachionus calyciflorus]